MSARRRPFFFERKHEELAPRRVFFTRLARAFALTMAIVVLSLGMGTVGYHYLGEVSWIDALLNASMILTGMGPVNPMKTDGAKLFATFYSLYSGIAFLTLMGIMAAPIYHRFLHKFHIDENA